MLEKLRLVESRYLELENMSGRPDFYDDPKKAAALLKEQRSLEPVVTAYRKYCAAQKNVEDMLEMLSMPLDPEMKELCQEELAESKAQLPRLEQELKILLLPKDPNDDKNVILEIRAGVGGEESALFAHSLYRMYAMYAEKKGWNIEITTLNENGTGRREGTGLYDYRPGGLFPAEIRDRRPSGAAGAGDGIRRTGPYLYRHRCHDARSGRGQRGIKSCGH